MRIVHVITRWIVGGAQENTLLSCEGQHKLGHDVTLITGPAIGPEGSLMDRALAGGYRVEVIDEMVRAIRPAKDFRAYRKLAARLGELRPDIVHTHSSKAGILGRWAASRAGIKGVVHTIHGLAFTASRHRMVNWVYKRLEKHAAPLTRKIVCVADAMRQQSLAAGIGTPQQYVTVYSGMEIEPFLSAAKQREGVRASLGIASHDVIVGTIARLFHMKGHDDLIRAAPQLCSENPRIRFLWVGDGLLRGEFESAIERLGLKDKFIFTGLVPPSRIPELAAAMDILAHPSRREGLARALPQGQLAGCPVVVYDIDGNREGLIPDQTGFLIPAFDQQPFAARIADLARDLVVRSRMGKAGIEFATARFSAETMVTELDRVYTQVLKA